MKLLLILFLIYSCGRGITEFSNESKSAGGNLIEKDERRVAEAKTSTEIGNGRSTEIGNGNKVDIEAEIDETDQEDPLEPVMVTASYLTACTLAGNKIQCSVTSEADLILIGIEVFDNLGKKIPDSAITISQENGLTITISLEYSVGSMTVNSEDVELIGTESLLHDVEGGIANGHFDVDAYSCNGEDGLCFLLKHVHEYDVKAKRNGIDLLNPSLFADDLGFSEKGVDFCIFVQNAEFSKEAVIRINENIFKATELDGSWSASSPCTAFRLDASSTNKLEAFELSFPVDVVDIPNGIMQSEPKTAQADPVDRAGSLIIRYVEASTGDVLKEINVYNHN